MKLWRITALLLIIAVGGMAAAQEISSASVSVDVLPTQLESRTLAANWVTYNGDYSGRRYSSLSQINTNNVAQLRAEWVFHSANSDRLEVTPVVVNGIMFATAANDTYALDARSGHMIWDVAYADWNKNYGATAAPLVVKDKVIVGTSGGDDGVRGFVAAYDALTGKLAWRFWTIPAPGEFGSESWPGDLYLHGGGTAWMSGTYDPGLNLLYWGTSNPAPDFEGGVRPGDDLYADCVLALEPDTGQLKWYFQFTPHDLFDYDATETPILIDAPYKGEPRKLLVEANRNGFIYVLDRVTGQLLSAISFVSKLNWAKGIDAKGRPILTHVEPTPEGTRICPGFDGATNWFSPSYNESTHLVYFLALEECETFFLKPEKFKEGQTFYSTGIKRIPTETSQKILLAYNLETQSFAWRYPQAGHAHSSGGTMTTAGGLLFFGDDADSFEALDAQTGKPLWHFNTGQDFSASPMSYAVDGKQYVAIAAGSDIFSFSLP